SANDRSLRPGGPRRTPAARPGRRPGGGDSGPSAARAVRRPTPPPPGPAPRPASPRGPTAARARRDPAARAPRPARVPAGCRESRRGHFRPVEDRLEGRVGRDTFQLELGRDAHPVAEHGGWPTLDGVGAHAVAPV